MHYLVFYLALCFFIMLRRPPRSTRPLPLFPDPTLFRTNGINACSMGSPGLDELRWLRPVRPGDTLKLTATVREKRPSKSKPDRGTLLMDYVVTNQQAEPVMTFTAIHILARKAG